MAHNRNSKDSLWMRTVEQLNSKRNNGYRKVSTFQRQSLQGLDLNTRSEALTGSLGLWPMEGEMDKAKLAFLAGYVT
jgi:hypothetical protein